MKFKFLCQIKFLRAKKNNIYTTTSSEYKHIYNVSLVLYNIFFKSRKKIYSNSGELGAQIYSQVHSAWLKNFIGQIHSAKSSSIMHSNSLLIFNP